jgi:hypothetical protein
VSIASLNKFQQDLRRLPTVVAQKVAAAAAPVLTQLTQATFNSSEDAYGNSWAPGSEGQKITLKKSGSLFSKIHYVAIGTKLRVALGVKYAKYQVGRRPVTPRQGSPLPVAYSEALARAAVAVCKAELGQ